MNEPVIHAPDVRVVDIARIVPHEIADPGRERRIEYRLQADGVQRDPLLVGDADSSGSLILLDGTNRRQALLDLGYDRALVQVLRYPDEVEVRTWAHAIDQPLAEVWDHAAAIPGIAAIPAAGPAMTENTLALLHGPEEVVRLERQPDGLAWEEQLYRLVNFYEARMERIPADRAQAPRRGAVASFPPISAEQVIGMARSKRAIPAGITRHVLPHGRALRINLPLVTLAAPGGEEASNALLGVHLATLHPRTYREPTILFDS